MDAQNLWFALLTILAIGSIALGVLIFHKTRSVHISTFTLERDLAATRKESEALFGQFQALLALERKLALPHELPPMRGWAGSPDFLLIVANELLLHKPKVVMECSSGVSTVIAARCMQLNGSGHVYSLEHDSSFAEKTRELLEKQGLTEWATVLDAPLETRRTDTPWYAEDAIPSDLDPIEVLIIDGPPRRTAPLARLPALPRLVQRMATDAMVILDDANREEEREIVKRWKSDFPDAVETRPMCEKGCVVLKLH